MALINWSDNLSVNVAEIDLQHKKLISMVNELNEAMLVGRGKDVLGKIISGLAAYTATHFKTEETYFARFGYPETAEHNKEHAAFIQKVSEFKDGFEKSSVLLTIQVMNIANPPDTNEIRKAFHFGMNELMGVTGPILFDDYGDVKHYPKMFIVKDGQVVSYQRYLKVERERILREVQGLLATGGGSS